MIEGEQWYWNMCCVDMLSPWTSGLRFHSLVLEEDHIFDIASALLVVPSYDHGSQILRFSKLANLAFYTVLDWNFRYTIY